MHFQAAALLVEFGMSPQDYTVLCEDYDLLAVKEGVLHDPESAAEDPAHLEPILKAVVAWIPGAVPYGDLWKDLRVGPTAAKVKLCASCFPPNSQ